MNPSVETMSFNSLLERLAFLQGATVVLHQYGNEEDQERVRQDIVGSVSHLLLDYTTIFDWRPVFNGNPSTAN